MWAQKLAKLREVIKKQSVDGFFQPLHDPFMSEYPPACFRRVEFLTGFTGSAGMVVALSEAAGFFSDGRYTLQAAQQVDGVLYQRFNTADMMPEAWAAAQMKDGAVMGYDPELTTRDMLGRWQAALSPRGVTLRPVTNLVDAIWKDRPELPGSMVFVHEDRYAGVSSEQKRAQVAAELVKAGADAVLLTAPDSVCWLLNIRARDTENTPLLLARALLDASGAVVLAVEPGRCDAAVKAHLGSAVRLVSPKAFAAEFGIFSGKKVACDSAGAPLSMLQALEKAGATVVAMHDPCTAPKAAKNAVELEGIRLAHVRDGVAVVRLLHWLEGQVGQRPVDELEVCAKLLAFRQLEPNFVEPSFDTISGSGPNGAIVHYRATHESNRTLKNGEFFLLDSGGQYFSGTTDITRTIAIGTPTPEMRDRFTRVLKGHIAIATAKFPEGTRGSQLDALARAALWQAELDYDHGTGHGVGCFLGVHEGPQRISKRGGDAVLVPGMVVSNEPGYYKTGEYGIRIENLVTVVEARTESTGRRWLAFDTLTCAPIDTRAVDARLLEPGEKEWLNAYHHWVQAQLSPHLGEAERGWLAAACRTI